MLEKAASLSRSVRAADSIVGINAGDFVEAGRPQDLFDVLVGAADRHLAAAANERLGAQHQSANAERSEEGNFGEVDNQSLAALRQLVKAGIDLLRALNVEAPVEHDVGDPIVAFDDFHVHAHTVRLLGCPTSHIQYARIMTVWRQLTPAIARFRARRVAVILGPELEPDDRDREQRQAR